MKRKVLFAGIVALASVFFFQGISMAGVCKEVGLSKGCVTTSDLKKQAVNNARIRVDTIKLNRMDNSVAGLNGNGMVKAWARMNSDGAIISCWRCNTNTGQTQRTSTGLYEVDFTPLSTDIRGRPRAAVLDGHAGILAPIGFASLTDRAGDNSSVFVVTRNVAGDLADLSFTVIIW